MAWCWNAARDRRVQAKTHATSVAAAVEAERSDAPAPTEQTTALAGAVVPLEISDPFLEATRAW